MGKDILDDIIGVEQEIRRMLDAEQRQAKEFLERLRKELAEEAALEEERLKESLKKAVEAAKRAAEEEAAQIMANASEQAERLSRVSDETLHKLVMKHLARLLPGNGS